MFKKQLLLGGLVLGLLGMGCSHSGQFSQGPKSSKEGFKISKKSSHFDIPMANNDRVSAWVDYFQGTSHERFERYLQRSGRYVTWMREMLKEEGLPQDLVYLALIESGFSNQAYSRAKASGPWQFIRSTGNHYGLSTNGWQDERRDPEKATRAAAQYLKKLYNEFGDWYLAMAAYNAGEGKIHQAVNRSGSTDFWKISAPGTRYLKPETKDYVPKFIAAALIAKNPTRYGFNNVAYHEPIAYEEVEVEGPLDFDVAAELATVEAEQIEFLNPELHRHITPPHAYKLKVPTGTKEKFEAAYVQLPPEKRVMMVSHKVRKGEDLNTIARRYGVSVAALVAANDLHGKHPRVRPGMMLSVPRGKAATVMASAAQEKETRRYSYKVKKHDSLGKIAARFGVSSAQIKKENHLKSGIVHAGQHLRITKQSKVAVGDMLAYNKKTKKPHMNGVEYLIRKQQDVGGTEGAVASDATGEAKEVADVQENVAPESVSVVEVPPEADKKTVATITAPIEESDLTENEESDLAPSEKPVVHKKATVVTNKKHIVKRGENLAKIARKYQVSVANLKQWNHLKTTKTIRAGQALVIHQPAAQTKREKAKQPSMITPTAESTELETYTENSNSAEAMKSQDGF